MTPSRDHRDSRIGTIPRTLVVLPRLLHRRRWGTLKQAVASGRIQKRLSSAAARTTRKVGPAATAQPVLHGTIKPGLATREMFAERSACETGPAFRALRVPCRSRHGVASQSQAGLYLVRGMDARAARLA
jgi:hypothetical protein